MFPSVFHMGFRCSLFTTTKELQHWFSVGQASLFWLIWTVYRLKKVTLKFSNVVVLAYV